MHDHDVSYSIHALKMWKHYLINKCEIYTEHKSLKYSFKQNELSMRQHRLLDLIKNDDLEILYHPGKANIEANGLNRRSYYNTLVASV